ncbi:MAG: hypothetical protein LBT05_10210 [Planctomycetaceae bacterium]|jgi:hypothetical protein|nr:hypothetical protein [Planctomycetaceae bacterium]
MSDIVNKIIRYCEKKNVSDCRHYSGRGMFGKCCIAFSGNTCQECIPIAETIRKKTGHSYCYTLPGQDTNI